MLAVDVSTSTNGNGLIPDLLNRVIFAISASIPVDAIWGAPGDKGVQQRESASGWNTEKYKKLGAYFIILDKSTFEEYQTHKKL